MNVAEHQRIMRSAPKVYLVYITCEGETDVHGLFETKELAQAARDAYNATNRGGYYGKASVGAMPLVTESIAAALQQPEDTP